MRADTRDPVVQDPLDPPPRTSKWFDLAAYLATFGAGLGWTSWLMARSTGTPNQDEIAHVLIAKHALHDPTLLLDAWGRPANTVAFVLPAQFGLTGARIGAIMLSVLTVLVTTRIAQHLGVKRLYLIPLFLWFQPWFHTFGHLALTEVPFTLYLACAILAWLKDRHGWAALFFGLLPLARWEALALLPLAGVYLLVTRRRRALAIMAAPLASYLVLSTVAGSNVNEVTDYLRMRAGAYGYGDLTHFFRTSAPLIGAPVLTLAAFGLPRLRSPKVLVVTGVWAAYFAIQVVSWYRGRGAGYAEFAMPVAAGLALLATFGTEHMTGLLERSRARVVLFAKGVVIAGAAAAVLALGFQSEPHPIDLEGTAMKEAAVWLRESGIETPRVLSTHAWFQYFYGIPFPTSHRGLIDGGRGEAPRTIMVWDRHYSNRWGYRLEDLQNPTNGWEQLETFRRGRAAIFVKL